MMSSSGIAVYLRAHPWARTALIVFLALSMAVGLVRLPTQAGLEAIDSAAMDSVEGTLARTTELFVVTKGINSVLSVAKTTEVHFSLGAGGAISPGAWLAPLDQLIDDFSDWLLEGAAAVAVIKILLAGIHQVGVLAFAGAVLPIVVIMSWLRSRKDGVKTSLYRVCKPMLAVLVFLRIGVPLAFVAMGPLFHGVLDAPYADAVTELKTFGFATDDPFSTEILGTIKTAAMAIATNAKPFFSSLSIVVGIMLLQIIIFPLLLTWSCWRFCRWLTTRI